MIASGDNVGACIVKSGTDFIGDAEAVCSVLAVDDDKVEHEAGAQFRQPVGDHLTPALTDNVSANQNSHSAPPISRLPSSVTTQSSG